MSQEVCCNPVVGEREAREDVMRRPEGVSNPLVDMTRARRNQERRRRLGGVVQTCGCGGWQSGCSGGSGGFKYSRGRERCLERLIR